MALLAVLLDLVWKWRKAKLEAEAAPTPSLPA
jgi:hypothetical protein